MRRRVTVLGYTFRLVLLSVFMVVIAFTGVMSAALQRSINDWNTVRNQNLQTTIGASVAQNYRVEGSLTPELLQDVLRPVLSPTMYVIVADTNRNPLYASVRGERIPIEPDSTLDSILESVPGTVALPNVLLDAGDVLGYVAAGTLGFTSDPVNQEFLRSMGVFLAFGVGLAILIGLISAVVFSQGLSRHARRVNGFLSRIAAGERDIQFPPERVIEFEKMLQSVNRLQDQLKHEEDLRRRWARDVAHDLRTPIAALKAQFEAMQAKVISPTDERIAALYSEVDRVERLVTDLRALNTMEEPRSGFVVQNIAAAEFLQRVIHPFSVQYGSERLKAICDAEYLCGDEHLLLRAVTNVVQNALQHGDDEKPVRIAVRSDGARSLLEIHNYGEVAEADVPYLFERLYRGERSRTTPGSGLGLSIAKAIIEQHHGTIELVAGRGETTVFIELPCDSIRE